MVDHLFHAMPSKLVKTDTLGERSPFKIE